MATALRVVLSAGQIAEIGQAAVLVKDQLAGFIVTDKGYDSDAFVETIMAQGSQAVIRPDRFCRSFIWHVSSSGWLD